MPITRKKDLMQRYKAYNKTRRAYEKQGLSIGVSILKAAIDHNVSEATIRNAMNNKPMKNELKTTTV